MIFQQKNPDCWKSFFSDTMDEILRWLFLSSRKKKMVSSSVSSLLNLNQLPKTNKFINVSIMFVDRNPSQRKLMESFLLFSESLFSGRVLRWRWGWDDVPRKFRELKSDKFAMLGDVIPDDSLVAGDSFKQKKIVFSGGWWAEKNILTQNFLGWDVSRFFGMGRMTNLN